MSDFITDTSPKELPVKRRLNEKKHSRKWVMLALLFCVFLACACAFFFISPDSHRKLPSIITRVISPEVSQFTIQSEETAQEIFPTTPTSAATKTGMEIQLQSDNSSGPEGAPSAKAKQFSSHAQGPAEQSDAQQLERIGISGEPQRPGRTESVETEENSTIAPPLKQSGAVSLPNQSLVEKLNSFYTHLDNEPYLQDFNLAEPSKIHFSKLLQKLLDNPPVISRETDNLFTLLKNTAHFFRILGNDNILLLKGILDREKGSLEDILATFYQLTFEPEQLKAEYGLTIPLSSLYQYGGYFLNTMGGRLYLFRRDSTSRMVVSYYAIKVVDRARQEGEDLYGIELLTPVNALIEEIENGGNKLLYREKYLDELYELKLQCENFRSVTDEE